MAELHVQAGEAVVEAGGHAILDRLDGAVDGVVGHTERVALAEGQEGAEAQGGGRVGLDQSVADEDTVFVRYEDLFLGQYHTAHAVGHAGHVLAVKLTQVFVTVGVIHAALVAVDAQVERRAVLYHGLVERREQHVGLVAHLRYGYHQQAVLLAGIAAHKCSAVISPGLIGAQHFLGQ